jgi:CheY-like chemotaxis protein
MDAPMKAATILVVDDDALIVMDLADMVRDLGHIAVEAHSGAEALKAMVSGAPFDALITDQAMPGMSGVELALAARALQPGLPVLVSTGYTDLPEGSPLDLVRLKKPCRPKELAEKLALALARA